jgi:CheY-like chemotaxis protein
MEDNFWLFMADDDMEDQQLFAEAVWESHPEVKIKFFNSGMDLLEYLKKDSQKPNVIFLDLHMRKMNGEETLKQLRAQSDLDEVPIVLYSGVYNLDYISSLFRLGANRYLHKPSEFKILVTALERTICSIKSNNLWGTSIINYV